MLFRVSPSLYRCLGVILLISLLLVPIFFLLHSDSSPNNNFLFLHSSLIPSLNYLPSTGSLSSSNGPYFVRYGVTLDNCTAQEQCDSHQRGLRVCAQSFNASSTTCPSNDSDACVCLPTYDPACTSDDECDSRELCAVRMVDGYTFCLSRAAFLRSLPTKRLLFSPRLEIYTYRAVGNGTALTRDTCQDKAHCAGNRICQTLGGKMCQGQNDCICIPRSGFLACVVSWECPYGEICAKTGAPVDDVHCVSRVLVQQNETFHEFNAQTNATKDKEEAEAMGLSYDRCKTSTDCMGPRECRVDRFGGAHECGDRGCRCFPIQDKDCRKDHECQDGEICAFSHHDSFIGVCMSKTVVKNSEGAFKHLVTRLQPLSPELTGVSGDRCTSDDSCKDDRICEENSEDSVYCNRWGSCFCIRPRSDDSACTSDGDCDEGESCVSVRSDSRYRVCWRNLATRSANTTSETSGENTSPTPKGVVGRPKENEAGCVDSRLLRDFKRRDLVYEKDLRARVLCDGWGNCATRGHIVLWKGSAMMMVNYCLDILAGDCRETEMWVNSPRWNRAIRIPGKGGVLDFTAFAAKWATKWEEHVLRMIVGMGF